MIEKKCVICGKMFNARNDTYKTCSSECCRLNKNAVSRKRKAQKKMRIPKVYHYALAAIEADARAVGLSYGRYVSKMHV